MAGRTGRSHGLLVIKGHEKARASLIGRKFANLKDFKVSMDVLKAEIAKKRKVFDALTPSDAKAAAPARKKYMKRGELEELEEKLEASKASNDSQSVSKETSAAQQSKPDGTSTEDAARIAAADDDDILDIPKEEIIGRLRSRGQPIRLFGESDRERIQRLRNLEAMEERTDGQRNDFQTLLDNADRGLALELLAKQAGGNEEQESRRKKKDQELDSIDTSVLSASLLEKDPDKARSLILVYLKRLMRDWGRSLSDRPEDEKRSSSGKLQSATQAQTGEYLKPFLKQLKNGSIKADILARVTEICCYMMQREYLKANDSYLRLSIGNAAWPIGVTMVGIHERSAREKIHASQVAHVLNDEVQRKWIQSIKRLMTFAQSKWPPSDLSKAIG
ncbi:mRNA splicing protein prp18 [Irineochytrium annulatum]|nr:mRNA splicing protein prp18 [Irineochytrium annulatum]